MSASNRQWLQRNYYKWHPPGSCGGTWEDRQTGVVYCIDGWGSTEGYAQLAIINPDGVTVAYYHLHQWIMRDAWIRAARDPSALITEFLLA